MEVLDVIEVRSVEVGDLIQFEAYIGEEHFTELLRVISTGETHDGDGIIIKGDSEVTGDRVTHILDPYLEVEVMGA
jgi:hypothetical protein